MLDFTAPRPYTSTLHRLFSRIQANDEKALTVALASVRQAWMMFHPDTADFPLPPSLSRAATRYFPSHPRRDYPVTAFWHGARGAGRTIIRTQQAGNRHVRFAAGAS
jgi:hypothetical protein